MRFNEGDIVRIHKNHDRYGKGSNYSPTDMNGRIVNIADRSFLPIIVKWDNGYEEKYCEGELRLYRR